MSAAEQRQSWITDTGPFGAVPLWVVELVKDARAIQLYAVLAAKYVDRHSGTAFPSTATLAIDMDCGRTTVKRAARVLKKARVVDIRPRRTPEGNPATNQYVLRRMPPDQDHIRPGVGPHVDPPPSTSGPRVGSPVVHDPDPVEPDPEEPEGDRASAVQHQDGLQGIDDEFWARMGHEFRAVPNTEEETIIATIQRLRSRRAHTPVSPARLETILGDYGPRFSGGRAEVLGRILNALDHKSWNGRKTTSRYITNWLDNDLDRRPRGGRAAEAPVGVKREGW